MVCLAGPTAAGKSHLALALAARFGGEIVNGDSLQFYRGMDIGTAKPTLAERAQAPHHLYDTLEPDQLFTAGDYATAARPVLAEIAARGRLPIVCGGAGFYLRALIDGLAEAPKRDQALRERLAEACQRPGLLHRYLRRLDADAAKRIHSNDRNKLIRAIEVCLTERPLSEIHARPRPALEGYRVLWLGVHPPRPLLYARIHERVDEMFARGLIDEVRALQTRGYGTHTKALEGVGYKQCLAYLAGAITLAEALAETKQRTRNYAKRQLTWFRCDDRIHWLSGFGTDETVINSAIEQVAALAAKV